MASTRYQDGGGASWLAAVRRRLRRLRRPARPRDELFEYWRRPGPENAPRAYLEEAIGERSRFLLELVGEAAHLEASILELGCNAGRNLAHLYRAGYRHLAAVEISGDALELFRATFPEIAPSVRLHEGPMEEVLPGIADGAHDLVFSMAVLEHVHTDSEFVFEHIARIAKETLITIEDERTVSGRHFARNYARVFEPLGFVQSRALRCDLADRGLGPEHVARVFTKR